MTESLGEFFGEGNQIKPSQVDPELEAILDNWLATIRTGGIGFLPRAINGRTYWYGFAPSARERRELLELLDAWVGPTYSDLAQSRGDLDAEDPFDIELSKLEAPPVRFEVLPRTSRRAAAAKRSVRDALLTLTRLVNNRPPSQFDAQRTTVEILDDLGHAVAVRDGDLAASTLAELEQAADFDQSNLAFLRIRVHAGMQAWDLLLADPALEEVLAMRRPLGVTRAIQSAVYFRHFVTVDHEGSEPRLQSVAESLEPGLLALYTGAPPTTRPEALVELLSRIRTVDVTPEDAGLAEVIRVAAGIEAGLDEHFRRVVGKFFPGSISHEMTTPSASLQDPISEVGALVISGQHASCIEFGLECEPSVEVGCAIVLSARQLSDAVWSQRVLDYLREHDLSDAVKARGPSFLEALKSLENDCQDAPSTGWLGWFFSLAETGSSAPSLSAVRDWPLLSLEEFKHLILEAPEAVLTKLGDGGGQFLAAHQDYLQSSDSHEVALQLVAAFALSGKASAGVRAQTLALVEMLTSSGAHGQTYVDLLDWASLVVGTNTSAVTVSWTCDVLSALTAVPTPDAIDATLQFFYKTSDALRNYRTALDGADVEALEVIASELSTELPDEFTALAKESSGEDRAKAYHYLAGKTVVLHSLTESAIIRAAQVLRRLVPTISVKTNSEHDGSPQLAQLSSNADYFVVVTASAKHAATTFISANRKGLPTLLVNSRGSSAILRALAEQSG